MQTMRAHRGGNRLGILCRQAPRVVEPRNHTAPAPPGALGNEVIAGVKERRISAKFIDQKSADHGGVFVRENGLRAHQLGDHTTPVDISAKDNGHVGCTCKPHIGNVAGAQIDLGRAAGAFDDNQIILAAQPIKAFQDILQQFGPARPVVRCVRKTVGPAVYDDLSSGLRLGFKEHRIHVHMWRQPRCLRLKRLRASDLAAFCCRGCIVRHVLRLERRDRKTLGAGNAAQPGDEQ